jgi:signal transduction histidine kinase
MWSWAARTVRRKLQLLVVATTLAALVITSIAMVAYDVRTYQHVWVADLQTQADILGQASAPALAFDDPKVAGENLALLKARPAILAAAIYTARGALFASYVREGAAAAAFPTIPDLDGFRIERGELVVFKRIVDRNEIVGTVYLRAQYQLVDRLINYLGILALVMLASLVAALALSARLGAQITRPIVEVSDVARNVMERRDFSLRATRTTQDEVGYLVDAFNEMLAEIGVRAEILESSNRKLEHEIVERREAEQALHVTERRNRTLVAAITSVVWTTDGGGRMNEEQASWQAYTGQESARYLGLGWRHAFEPRDRDALEAAWAGAIEAPGLFQLELRLWHAPTHSYRYVGLRAVPIVGEVDNVHEWIGTVSDIHDQRMAEDALRKLNAELERRVAERTAELEASNRDLEGFSYSVSHDLRAPVRVVAGFAKLLGRQHADQLDAEARQKVEVIQNETLRMGVLIDDLLMFARLGRQAIRAVELDMTALARGVFERLNSQHTGNPVEFQVGSLPTAIGDRVLLEQVWTNFLSNALKFSAKRERPVITVDAISDAAEYIYFVRDNGAGFDPRYQSKLFGVFQRLHGSSEFAGNGVGLALVHRIVTRHGGRVWADGKVDHGATFYFSLPRDPDAADPAAA